MYEDTRLKMRPCIRLCRIDSIISMCLKTQSETETCFQQTGSIPSQDEISSNSSLAESHSEIMNDIKEEIQTKRERGPTTAGSILPTEVHHASPKSHIQQPTAESLGKHLNKVSASDFTAENVTDRNESFTLGQAARLTRSKRNTRSLVQLSESLSKENQVHMTADINETPTQNSARGKCKIGELKIHDIQAQCPLCDKTFANSGNVRRHKRRVHLRIYNYKYDCEDCELRFTARNKYVEHRRRYHTFEKPFQCHISQKRHCTREGARSHLVNHTGIKPVTCKKCGQLFARDSNLKTHLRTCKAKRNPGDMSKYGVPLISVHHKNSKHTSGVSNPENKVMEDTTKCENEWITQKNFPNCTSSTSRNVTVSANSTRATSNRHTTVRLPADFRCEICNMLFESRELLTQHRPVHESTTGKWFQRCDVCSMLLTSIAGLKKHKKHVHDIDYDRNYVCDFCGQCFYIRNAFLSHIRHCRTGEKPYVCDQCQKSFASALTLRAHQIRHSGQLPHKCSLCGKGFPYLISLRSHLLSHSGVAQYSCPICKRPFPTETALKCHRKSVMPQSCNNCPELFCTNNALELHLKICQPVSPKHVHVNNYDLSRLSKVWMLLKKKENANKKKESFGEEDVNIICEQSNMDVETDGSRTVRGPQKKFEKEIICDFCGKVYASKTSLYHHRRAVHLRNYFRHACEFCGKRFYKLEMYRNHVNSHTGKKPYGCDICKQNFSSKDSLRAHMLGHLERVVCNICNKSFSNKYTYKYHVQQVHLGERRSYTCDICQKTIKNKYNLRGHMRSHIQDAQEKKAFQCERRSQWFVSSKGRDDHVNKACTVGGCYICRDCMKPCASKRMLLWHMEHTHKEPMLKRLFACTLCSKRFERKFRLADHMITHGNEKPFQCSHCQKAFFHQKALKIHQISHQKQKNFTCSECSTKFKYSNSLSLHRRKYCHASGTYLCRDCPSKFATKEALTSHFKRKHISNGTPKAKLLPRPTEKLYKCDVCFKSFAYKQVLETHMNSHAGKQFKCEYCSKPFTYKNSLWLHMKSHSKNLYKCEVCFKSFAYKQVLETHMNSHAGKQFKCEKCSKPFTYKNSLWLHMKKYCHSKNLS